MQSAANESSGQDGEVDKGNGIMREGPRAKAHEGGMSSMEDIELSGANGPTRTGAMVPSETCKCLLRFLSQYPISTTIALGGWATLIGLSAVPDAVCATLPTGVQCLHGKSYLTLALLLGALLLMVNDAAPDLVMLAFSVLLVVAKVISDEEAWVCAL